MRALSEIGGPAFREGRSSRDAALKDANDPAESVGSQTHPDRALPALFQFLQDLPRDFLKRFKHPYALEGYGFDHGFVFLPQFFR
jgi:hypothetical protein